MANTIANNGQTCLEIHGIENRNIAIAREDYSQNNPYSSSNPDALASDGKALGKGAGGNHTHWLPSCSTNETKNIIDYSNFTTEGTPGGCYDVKAREVALARSMYNKENMYGSELVNTEKNEQAGQYILSNSRTKPNGCSAEIIGRIV
jgi:hypothetical protein